MVLLCLGIMLIMTCPPDRLDMDHAHWGVQGCFFIVACLMSLVLAISPPHVYIVGVFPPMAKLIGSFCCADPFVLTGLVASWQFCCLSGDAAWAVFAAVQGQQQANATHMDLYVFTCTHVAFAFFSLLGACAMPAVWCRYRSMSRTTALFYCTYTYLIATAFATAASSITSFADGEHSQGCARALQACARGLPFVIYLSLGPQKLFQLTAKRFDNNPDRAEQDGAFVAALMEGSKPQPGSVHWVHRVAGEEQDACATDEKAGDHAKNWRRGVITDVNYTMFTVKVEEEPRLSAKIVEVPYDAGSMDPKSLVEMGRSNLRCMDWPDVTEELIKGKVCGSNNELLASNAYYQLSRPVKPDEVVDFFLSNSWHDDAEVKWAKLNEEAVQFHEKRGRPFTLWLDKTCIDQTRIRDGLQVLPVNVMACNKVMILWGHTYPTRLWCVWEIFTVLAFSSLERAAERLYLVPLTGRAEDAIEELQQFDVARARCYDPNEQARLMTVISALGQERFNTRIHQMGHTLSSSRATSSRTLASASRSLALFSSFSSRKNKVAGSTMARTRSVGSNSSEVVHQNSSTMLGGSCASGQDCVVVAVAPTNADEETCEETWLAI